MDLYTTLFNISIFTQFSVYREHTLHTTEEFSTPLQGVSFSAEQVS